MRQGKFVQRCAFVATSFTMLGCTYHPLATLMTAAALNTNSALPAVATSPAGTPEVPLAAATIVPTAAPAPGAISGKVLGPADGFITNNGAGIISSNAGNLVGNNAGGLIANNAAGLIANNSSGVVGGNTSGLVGGNTGSLMSTQAGGYALLFSRDALVPIAGAHITLRDAKGNSLPLAGVTTDQAGAFSIDFTALKGTLGPVEVLATAQRDGRGVTFATFAAPASAQKLVLEPATTIVSRRLEAIFAGLHAPSQEFDVAVVPALAAKLLPLLNERGLAASILLDAGAASQVYDALTHNQVIVDAFAPIVTERGVPSLLPAGAHASAGATGVDTPSANGLAGPPPDAGGGSANGGGGNVSLGGGTANSGGANVSVGGAGNGSPPVPAVVPPVLNAPITSPVALAIAGYDMSGSALSSITISGTGFDPLIANDSVSFAGGFNGVVTAATATSLTVQVPAIANTGPITVSVSGQTVVGTQNFQVIQSPTPNVTAVSLAAASPGMTVTITGSLLDRPGTIVKFNGSPAVVLASSPTSLKVVVPEGATSGRLTVTLGQAYGAAPNNFTVLAHGSVQGSYAVGPNPHGLTLDASGNVWVGSTDGPWFRKFALDGTVLATYPVVTGPLSFTFDGAGNIWALRNLLYRYDTTGTLQGSYQTGLFGSSIATDVANNVWVTGTNLSAPAPRGRVEKFDRAGTLLGTFNVGSNPQGVVIAPDQTVWIANAGESTITHLSNQGVSLGNTKVDTGPFALAYDPALTLWSANSAGQSLDRFGQGGSATSIPTGGAPNALAFDANGNVWVTNNQGTSGAPALFKLSPSGASLASYSFGPNALTAVLVDGLGFVWVLDRNAGVVKRVAP